MENNPPLNKEDITPSVSDQNSDQSSPSHKKHTKKILIVLVGLMIIMGSAVWIASKKTNDSLNTNQNASVQPTSYEPSKPAIQRERWVLKRKTDQGSTDILTFSSGGSSYYFPSVVRWKDLLLYVNQGGLYSHDIKTGETKLVFTVQEPEGPSTNNQKLSLGSPQIVQDTLFFTAQRSGPGFTAEGSTYAIDLPPKGSAVKVVDIPGKIEKIKDRYWVVVRTDSGDTCGGRVTYALLDMATKKGTLIAITHIACQKGDWFIDIDKNNRMIIAGNTGGDNTPLEYGGHLGKYLDVNVLPLSNPSLREPIINKTDMPDGITEIQYLEDRNELLLLGKSAYLFDLTTKKLSKVVDFPSTWVDVWIPKAWVDKRGVDKIKGDIVCLQNSDAEGAQETELNLQTKQFAQNSVTCKNMYPNVDGNPYQSPPPPYADQLTKAIQELNLPSNYQLVQE